MKFSLSWLREHLDTNAALDAILEAMTMAGLEVESVDDPAARLAPFTVAHVIEAGPHPDADKLKVCRVATVDGEKQIVCGAPNAKTGLVGVYAPLGTFIPGLDLALDTKPRKIRGVESQGMLCSAKELEAGEDHDGIIELAERFDVGTPAATALKADDPVIDFEVTPNRPDWLGVVGIARDLAAAGLGSFKDEPAPSVTDAFACPVTVAIEDTDGCPAFAGRLVRGVKNGPSPEWLQARLRAVGIAPKSILVDVTNYLSYQRARPLHVFDAGKLSGDLVVREAKAGERFVGLDDKEHILAPGMVAIADDTGVISLGGVMGGASTGCDEATTDVFIEAALFDPVRTARTGRATGLTSDAQYRFARGVDPHSVMDGLDRATALILDLCGGEASAATLAGAIPAGPAPFEFELAQVPRLTGLTPTAAEVTRILKALGFAVSGKGATRTVTAPSWRGDVEGSADVVEEVARIVGYDALPLTPLRPDAGRRAPAVAPAQRRVSAARRAAAARGLSEAVTWSFCRLDQAAVFGGGDEALRLANPISSELDVMRPSALIHLLTALQRNADRGFPHTSLFECGPIYAGPNAEDQETAVAGVRAAAVRRHWAGARLADVFDVKADALGVLSAAGAPADRLQISDEAPSWWTPGQAGVLKLGPKVTLGVFGAVHPKALKALGVDGPVMAFEVYPDRIPLKRASGPGRAAYAPSDFMPLTRDFAFELDAATPAGAVIRAAAGADKALIADVRIFDEYAGERIAAGKKSLALEVTLQPADVTLDDAAIDAVSDKIVAAVTKATGGVLRA